ncbi:MAG: class I SAM-dependent methyltransferase [Spirochaetia bacterium]
MNCPVCEAIVLKQITHSRGREYGSCENCGLFFMLPEHRQPPEAEKYRYTLHNNSIEEPGYVKYLEGFLNAAVYSCVEKGASVLDYGSGPEPVMVQLMKRRGYKALGYDPYFSPDKSVLNKVYDCVTCVEVIEHMVNPSRLFKDAARMLPPDRMLFIRTELHAGDDEAFRTWWYPEDETHVSFFAPKTIEHLCVFHGFSLEWIKKGHYISCVKK